MNWRMIGVLCILLVSLITGMIWHVARLQSTIVTSTALRTAQIYSTALMEFRAIYTSEVVEPALRAGLNVTHDYIDRDHAIPLPATLSMILGEKIGEKTSGAVAQLYSPYPFPWQQNVMTTQDTFKQTAWKVLNSHPDQPFYQFEKSNTHTTLRYATSDIMRSSCVTCHNTHPDTPKNDWKVGDVRGVLEIRLPLDDIVQQTESDLRSMVVIYSVIGLLAIFGIGHTVSTLRKQAGELQRRVNEQTQALQSEVMERRRSEQEAKKNEIWNRTIVETTMDAIIMINTEGSIFSVNSATENLFGYTGTEMIGKNVNMLMPDPHHTRHDAYLKRYLDTKEARIIGNGREVTAQRKDRSLFPVYLTVGEAIIEEELMFVGVIHDITKQKDAERLKDEFVSTVSHELRTPLTSIKGALAFISEGVAGKLSPQVKELADIARRNSDRLILLINDLLDIEKIQAGKMTFQMSPIKISDLIHAAVEENQNYGDQYNIHLLSEPSVESDVIVMGDEHRLIQVLTNLLSNAIKFSPLGAQVEIATQDIPEAIRVSVTDYGAGIPDEFHTFIFDKFTQVDTPDGPSKKGTGLGLAIAREIVNQHGGTIGFETRTGEGTTFYFDLPVVDRTAAKQPKARET